MTQVPQTADNKLSARDRGIELYDEKAYSDALPLLQETYQASNETDDGIGILLAWSLVHTFQLNAAKELFETILERVPHTLNAIQGYWFTLNSLGKGVEFTLGVDSALLFEAQALGRPALSLVAQSKFNEIFAPKRD